MTLIGSQGDERITAEQVAVPLETINYEVTCGISARCPIGRKAGARSQRFPVTRVLGLEVLGQRALGAPGSTGFAKPWPVPPPGWSAARCRDIASAGRPTISTAVTGSPEVPARAIAKALDGIAFELSEGVSHWRVQDRDDAGRWTWPNSGAPDIERDLEPRR